MAVNLAGRTACVNYEQDERRISRKFDQQCLL
jgi:hypothetical protein